MWIPINAVDFPFINLLMIVRISGLCPINSVGVNGRPYISDHLTNSIIFKFFNWLGNSVVFFFNNILRRWKLNCASFELQFSFLFLDFSKTSS